MRTRIPLLVRQSGLSLIELMIALTIGFLVVAGVGYLFLGSTQAFRSQDSLSTIQENARYALEMMGQKVRMAGYIGCADLATVTPNNHVVNLGASNVMTSARAIQVFPAGAGWAAPAGVVRTAGDVLRIYEAAGQSVAVQPASSATSTVVGANPYSYQTNDILLISNCQNADIFTATSNPNAITHTALSQPYNSGAPVANLYAFQRIDYFIGCPAASWSGGVCSVPVALYQAVKNSDSVAAPVVQALIDNVENVTYSLGQPAGPTIAYSPPAAVVNWANVLSVQAHLLMVGGPAGGNSNVTATKQTYNFNNVSYTATDRRMYQEVVATMAIRNRIP